MNRNLFSTLCCALLCSVLFCTPSQAQIKQLKIVKPYAPLLQRESASANIELYLDGFNVENLCSGKIVQQSWHLLDSNKTILKNTFARDCQELFPTLYRFSKNDATKKFYVRYKVINNCGNIDSIDYLIDLNSVKPRKFECGQGILVDLLPLTNNVMFSALQFHTELTSEKATEFRIDKPYSLNHGYIFQKGVPLHDTISANCLGILMLRIWAKYPNTDWSFCTTYAEIQNNLGATPSGRCDYCMSGVGQQYAKGTIITSNNGKAIDNAEVIVESPLLIKGQLRSSVRQGQFSAIVPNFNNFKLYPIKDDNPLNGVSTFDLILMSKHILGNQLITDKYTLIAADVNNSGKITTGDVVELRKMILGVQKDFSNNKSWRFFNEFMKEAVDSTQNLCNYNFTAVKIGDINGNANPVSAPRSLKTHIFNVENKDLNAADTYTLSLKGIEGFAFTLHYDTDKLELISLDENSALLENGVITTVQTGSEFKAIFKAKANVTLSDAIHINSDITHAEAIVTGELQDIALQFNHNATTFEAKIYPNPVNDVLTIETSINSEGEIIICNLLGQVLVNQSFSESEKTTMNLDFLPKGIYWLTLKTNKGNKSMKLRKE